MEKVFAEIEVCTLNLFLGLSDGFRHHAELDRLIFGQIEFLHDAFDPVAAEDAQKIVLERKEELRRTGVALPAGAAAKLVVDTAGLMAVGADHVQSSERADLLGLRGVGGVPAKQNVHAAA